MPRVAATLPPELEIGTCPQQFFCRTSVPPQGGSLSLGATALPSVPALALGMAIALGMGENQRMNDPTRTLRSAPTIASRAWLVVKGHATKGSNDVKRED